MNSDRNSYGNGSGGGGPGPIPNRWLLCPRTSESFIADKFLAFKTPLSARFSSQIPVERQFQPDMVFSYMKMYKLKLSLWIDLTNTKRFYDRKEIEVRGCQYTKLQCRGHGETPSPEQTQSFIEIVDNFIIEHPLDVVGVHCTHGFNRTGFLIVSYMVEKMDCSVEAALMAFANARPPGIYKGDYIKELYRRYDDEDDAPSPPELPAWCLDYDDGDQSQYNNSYTDTSTKKRKSDASEVDNDDDIQDDDNENGETSSSTDGGSQKKKRKRKEFLNLNATFMTGVSGVTLVTDQPRLGNLQEKVQNMCKWNKSGFPGCQPVSMDMNNITFLHKKLYRVSWKADGTRYMMLILKENEIYFFDRDNSCFQVDGLRFPLRSNLREHLVDTLIDGEMVIDKVNGLSIPRYLVYDIVSFMGEDFAKRRFFPERLQCIKANVVEARYKAMQHGLINKQLEPFSVRDKSFWEVEQAKKLLDPKFAKNLCHEPDGLIFQPAYDPYVSGRCDDVLKWKPLDMNSVDFKLKITQESGMGIVSRKIGLLFVGQFEQPFDQIKYTKQLKELNGKIIECKYENKQWVFMRERTDKSFPNSYNTAKAVCNSISCPVTTEFLLDYIENYRFMDDSQMMPPPRPIQQQHQHQHQQQQQQQQQQHHQ